MWQGASRLANLNLPTLFGGRTHTPVGMELYGGLVKPLLGRQVSRMAEDVVSFGYVEVSGGQVQ